MAICSLALALTAVAGAAVCAPPGNSGVSQYLETVPGDSCSVPSSGAGAPHHGASLAPGTSKELARKGAAGLAVERLVSSTAPSTSAGTGGRGVRSGARAGSGAPASSKARLDADAGRGVIGGVLHPILTGSSSGGLGAALPLLLAATLGAILATMGSRRRRSG